MDFYKAYYDRNLIEKIYIIGTGGLYKACKSGHLDIVNLVIEKGANDWNRGLIGAYRGGNLEIVNLMLERAKIVDVSI